MTIGHQQGGLTQFPDAAVDFVSTAGKEESTMIASPLHNTKMDVVSDDDSPRAPPSP